MWKYVLVVEGVLVFFHFVSLLQRFFCSFAVSPRPFLPDRACSLHVENNSSVKMFTCAALGRWMLKYLTLLTRCTSLNPRLLKMSCLSRTFPWRAERGLKCLALFEIKTLRISDDEEIFVAWKLLKLAEKIATRFHYTTSYELATNFAI